MWLGRMHVDDTLIKLHCIFKDEVMTLCGDTLDEVLYTTYLDCLLIICINSCHKHISALLILFALPNCRPYDNFFVWPVKMSNQNEI